MPIGQRRGLRPDNGRSIWPYEWSHGRKRAWLELPHQGSQLPPEALVNWYNFLTSHCTSEHADIRLLGGFPVTVVEILSVRCFHDGDIQVLTTQKFFPEYITWRAIAVRLRNGGWKAGQMREYIVGLQKMPPYNVVLIPS